MLQTFDKDFYSMWPSFWNPWMMGWSIQPPSISAINFIIKPPLKSISPNRLWDVYFMMYFTTPSCWPLLDLFKVIMEFSRGLLLFSKILKHLLLRIGMALQASTIRAIFGRRSLSDPIRLGLLHTSLGQVSRKGLKTKKLEETATHLTWEGD